MATIIKVTITETMLNLHLSDHSVRGWALVDATACFLFTATKAQRDNWDI